MAECQSARPRPPSNLPELRADARSIKQILLNLLCNAIRFTPSGGEVTVFAGADDEGGVSLVVRDDGVGMGETEMLTAMEPFGQADPLAQSRPRGIRSGPAA